MSTKIHASQFINNNKGRNFFLKDNNIPLNKKTLITFWKKGKRACNNPKQGLRSAKEDIRFINNQKGRNFLLKTHKFTYIKK